MNRLSRTFKDSDLLMLITMGWHVSTDRTTAHKMGDLVDEANNLIHRLIVEPPGWRIDYPEGSYLLTKHTWKDYEHKIEPFCQERTATDVLWLVSSWQTRQSLGTPSGLSDCLHPYKKAGVLLEFLKDHPQPPHTWDHLKRIYALLVEGERKGVEFEWK